MLSLSTGSTYRRLKTALCYSQIKIVYSSKESLYPSKKMVYRSVWRVGLSKRWSIHLRRGFYLSEKMVYTSVWRVELPKRWSIHLRRGLIPLKIWPIPQCGGSGYLKDGLSIFEEVLSLEKDALYLGVEGLATINQIILL
jgi:hypothetical protein